MDGPVLVLLNGIPGSGKSTLARAWTERHADPLALSIDIDVVRSMLGRWRDDAPAAGLAARAMTIAAVGVHLRTGHDVVVPQYLRRAEFVDELGCAAQEAGARFVECAIVIDAATATARLVSRTVAAAGPGPGPEGELEQSVEAIHEDFTRFLATRHHAVVIRDGTVEHLEEAVLTALSGSGP